MPSPNLLVEGFFPTLTVTKKTKGWKRWFNNVFSLYYHFCYVYMQVGMCKILLEGQMSGKKWEDALSFKCTLVGEYI